MEYKVKLEVTCHLEEVVEADDEAQAEAIARASVPMFIGSDSFGIGNGLNGTSDGLNIRVVSIGEAEKEPRAYIEMAGSIAKDRVTMIVAADELLHEKMKKTSDEALRWPGS